QRDDLPVLRRRRPEIPPPHEELREVGMDVSETGANARSAAIFLERRVEAPRELEEAPEGLVRDESVGIRLGRVSPERDRVVPDLRLPQRERPEAHQDQGREGDPGTPAPGPSPGG